MNAVYTGQKIRELRAAKELTQRDLAAALGVTDAAVSKWERGKNFPDITLLEPLSAVLECPVSDLLGLENDSEEEIVRAFAELSRGERRMIRWEIIVRNLLLLGLAAAVFVITLVLISALTDHGLTGAPLTAAGGLVACAFWAAAVSVGALRSSRKLVLQGEPGYRAADEAGEPRPDVSPGRRLAAQIVSGGLIVYIGIMILLAVSSYQDPAATERYRFMMRNWMFAFDAFLAARFLLLKESRGNMIALVVIIVCTFIFRFVILPWVSPWV